MSPIDVKDLKVGMAVVFSDGGFAGHVAIVKAIDDPYLILTRGTLHSCALVFPMDRPLLKPSEDYIHAELSVEDYRYYLEYRP